MQPQFLAYPDVHLVTLQFLLWLKSIFFFWQSCLHSDFTIDCISVFTNKLLIARITGHSSWSCYIFDLLNCEADRRFCWKWLLCAFYLQLLGPPVHCVNLCSNMSCILSSFTLNLQKFVLRPRKRGCVQVGWFQNKLNCLILSWCADYTCMRRHTNFQI